MAIFFYQNDPLAKNLPLVQGPPTQATPTSLPLSIQGGLPGEMLYATGTEEFSRWAAYSTLLNTVEQAQQLTRALTKWHGGITLSVDVRAGVDFNAYYDRAGLHFFYDQDPVRGKPVYTSDSPDVVSHECGHAILDALRPQYWNVPYDEVGAFHESFGDMIALLTTLTWVDVRQAAVQAGLDAHNPAADLAEELGTALHNTFGPEACPPDYLRSGINNFNYQEPETLPPSAPDANLSSEVHSFSRVFTGVFYDILVGLTQAAGAATTAEAALANARSVLGQLLFAAVQRTPVGARLYRSIARSMLRADEQLFGGNHADLLSKVFQARNILVAAAEKPGVAPELVPVLQAFSLAPGMAPRQMAARETWTSVAQQAAEVAPRVGLGEGRSFRVEHVWPGEEAVHVQLSSPRSHQLRGRELGVADGVVVELGEVLSLQFDAKTGKAIAGDVYRPETGDVELLQKTVARLVQRRRVGHWAPGLPPRTLVEQARRRQPFYVSDDARGVRRLYRAYFDCSHP